jgi:uncharacterized flavoprotein (TIGR03862 family)
MPTSLNTSDATGSNHGAAASTRRAIVVGAGPAGLIAAETLALGGVAVTVCDRMPSPARKFLLAGRGGLNLTHSEPLEAFLVRYGTARQHLEPAVTAFPPDALRAWCEALGQETFIGSSGRVFPRAMKASPLLRAWLTRLDNLGVQLQSRSRWTGWREDGALTFDTPAGPIAETPDCTIFALGGASWQRLGSDGLWRDHFAAHGATVAPLRPANSGFYVAWSDIFRERFAGQPLKSARYTFNGVSVRGDSMITREGIEGGAIYALSAALRDAIEADGSATLEIDLHAAVTPETLFSRLTRSSASGASTANCLRKAGISPLAAALLREDEAGPHLPSDHEALARRIKQTRIRLTGTASIDRAISTAGGITWNSLNPDFSLRADPASFVCGEMLDWEAPTGGYLLQACFATGRAAAFGALARIKAR